MDERVELRGGMQVVASKINSSAIEYASKHV